MWTRARTIVRVSDRALNRNLVIVSHFEHILITGFDGYGHIYSPNSKEYLGNIKSVDSGIHRMVNVFESFYENDGKTAYILTADHGMSELGSHGNGHPDVILTPIVAWGAGVQGPVMAATGNDVANDYLSREWELDRLKRLDVSQIDIPALMSTLVGKLKIISLAS